MIKKVYTYLSKDSEVDTFVEKRNKNIVDFYAKTINAEYLGNFTLKNHAIDDETLIFLQSTISPSEAKELGITNRNQFYGAVIPNRFSYKGIFRPVIREGKVVQDSDLIAYLRDCKLLLPGYTTYTKHDAIKAFNLLKDRGFTVRLKVVNSTGGGSQFIISTQSHLTSLLEKLSIKELNPYGVVLEANVINPYKNKETEAYSIGKIRIKSKVYTYIGIQEFQDTGTPDRYIGSKLTLVNGDFSLLSESIKEISLKQKLNSSIPADEFMKYLTTSMWSRYNFDFLYGQIENTNTVGYFLTDQSFMMSSATVAELLGIITLENNVTSVSNPVYSINFGTQNFKSLKDGELELFNGFDPRYGMVQVLGIPNE